MLLEVSNLAKEYSYGNRAFYAVKDVWLNLKEGDLCIITGRSGSGKTTLLNLIAGLLRPSFGEVVFEGYNIVNLSDKQMSFVRNQKIGFIPQGQSILANLTVIDNVCLPYCLQRRKGDIKKKAIYMLEQLGIANLAESYPKHLSGGELRRVAIARALINEPKLVLADEPTNDLDTQTSKDVMRLFCRLAAGGTAVVLVSHDPDAIRYGNRIYQMYDGRLIS